VKKLVVGLGNPILGDDGVGWVVAEEVKKILLSLPSLSCDSPGEESSVDVDCLSLGGISLMERLIGYDRAILVDAFVCEEEVGEIVVSELDELPDLSAFHLTSVHDLSLQNAMKLGRQMGARLPDEVVVVGISARHIYDFSEELSPPVREAVPKATQIVAKLLA
jgi:hydrogenase maturation protease